MSEWTDGYVADITYTYGYYGELNPQRIRMALAYSGVAFPTVGAACELGFGQGLSTNIHAAASLVSWHGTDFNPSQAGFAQDLAASAGRDARLFDESFQEFCSREDLPDFDFIALHGIWSWISDENRAVIVDFLRRKLKVGGVLYMSYNTLPGWSSFAPMRHLMTQHAQVLGSTGVGVVGRINSAIDFADTLMGTNPSFSRAHPVAKERLAAMKGQNRHYLAHEYFNAEWHPMYFSSTARHLESAKLHFACSAHLLDLVEGLNFTEEQRKFMATIPDASFRETVRDFMVNQQFRRDYWVKGVRQLSQLERVEAFRRMRLMLLSPRQDVALTCSTTVGQVNLNENIYAPVLDALADHRVRTLEQVEQAVAGKGLTVQHVIEAIVVLVGNSHVALVAEDSDISKSRKGTDRLNAYLMGKARSAGDITTLASPLTGGGITVGRFQQLFLTAIQLGHKKPEDWALHVWKLLAAQGQAIIKDGKTLATPEENLDELTTQAIAFNEKQLPLLKALLIA